MIYIAQVIDVINYEDCVRVLLLGGSSDKAKCRVLHKRANPLYGNTGNLPDIGEKGIVVKTEGYGDDFFWIGSFHDLVENICTEENKKAIFHHDSDAYYKIDKDANIELSHPSGFYIKVSTANDRSLSQRTRYARKDGTVNLKKEINYNMCKTEPVNVYLEHTRKRALTHTDSVCPNDNRKQHKIYDLKKTKIDIDNDGDITLTHETDTDGKSFTLNIDKDGNLTVNCPSNITVNTNVDVTFNTTRDIKAITTRNNIQTTTGAATRSSNSVSESATTSISDSAANINQTASSTITQTSNIHNINSNAFTCSSGGQTKFQYANGEFRIWGHLRLMTGNLYIDEGNAYIHQGDLVVGGDITAEGSITANHTHG